MEKRSDRRMKRNLSDDVPQSRKKKMPKITKEESSTPKVSRNSSEGVFPSNYAASMYDDLLMVLGLRNQSLDPMYMTKKRAEDNHREECSGTESLTCGEDDEGGSDMQDSTQADVVVSNDNIENQTAVVSSKSTTFFEAHLGLLLTQNEVDDLSKREWKFRRDVPSVEFAKSKWVFTKECLLNMSGGISDYDPKVQLHEKLYEHWLELYKSSEDSDLHTSRCIQFLSLCNSYSDILHCNKRPFYLKGSDQDSNITDAYVMHALNHVFRTRELVNKNEDKLAKLPINGDGFLDRGFTRPKVLFLLPLASIAFRVVKRLIKLTPFSHKVRVEHMDTFSRRMGADENELRKSVKPSDYEKLFGGNNEDRFVIGIKFSWEKKMKLKSLKLYSDFYSSDMIIASPLGLASKIDLAAENKEKDVDYLSSIEVLIIDHADVISMQNWNHVEKVVTHMNNVPSKQHGTDVMRIRQWYLNGHARFYRQSILLGSYLTPEMNSLFNRQCLNYHGKVKSVKEYEGVHAEGVLQIYQRFDAPSIAGIEKARFDYFSKKVFPKIKDSIQGGIMLFVSSRPDFVCVRNFLKSQKTSFCSFEEYIKPSDISAVRNKFIQGRRKIMLYTERAHFYYRYKISGVKNLIIYSLPERKEFYLEILNMLKAYQGTSCTVLFSRFDSLRLARIVGNAHTQMIMSSEKDTFVFI